MTAAAPKVPERTSHLLIHAPGKTFSVCVFVKQSLHQAFCRAWGDGRESNDALYACQTVLVAMEAGVFSFVMPTACKSNEVAHQSWFPPLWTSFLLAFCVQTIFVIPTKQCTHSKMQSTSTLFCSHSLTLTVSCAIGPVKLNVTGHGSQHSQAGL